MHYLQGGGIIRLGGTTRRGPLRHSYAELPITLTIAVLMAQQFTKGHQGHSTPDFLDFPTLVTLMARQTPRTNGRLFGHMRNWGP